MIDRLNFIRALFILEAFLICLVYTYKIKGPWWALAAFVGCELCRSSTGLFPKMSEDNECVFGKHKTKHSWVFGNGCCDFWNFLHFFFWILIGLLVPGMYVPALVFSVLYEIFEEITMGRGRGEDVFINMAGYTIGSLLSKAR